MCARRWRGRAAPRRAGAPGVRVSAPRRGMEVSPVLRLLPSPPSRAATARAAALMIDAGPEAGQRRGRRRPGREGGQGWARGFEVRQPRRRSRGHWGPEFVGGGEPGWAEGCSNCNLRRCQGGHCGTRLETVSESELGGCQTAGAACLSVLLSVIRV